ncbi:MAG: 16S rRNA (cytosine(1402)-N(4))-methyltransferase RsmH [Proteobacteria bacterium]|nr:16S rRNA (cytosine(1402)-N(4))-methyltransferase RsmH [Pseudomonadota bacterium]
MSSHQINLPYRGFSFSMEGPLDMRMDPRTGFPASHFLNNAEESDIANVLWSLGEEQKSRQIARKIVLSRTAKPFQTTSDLSKLISSARLWPGNSKKNPATKTFQALRIHVNDELGELNTLVDDGFGCLEVGAVMTIISFHSLEDRIVKTKFQSLCGKSKRAALPKGIPFTEEQIATLIDQKAIIVGPFPGTPSADEILANPRSRSAKLRSIQKTTK